MTDAEAGPPSLQPPQDWLDALARADADVAAGRVVDSADIHRELRDSVVRMRARRRQRAGAVREPGSPVGPDDARAEVAGRR